MDLIRAAISRPVAVIAAVLMVLLFGFVALERIPIQLIPDVRKPVISVETEWTGAAPAEVEREIVNRQEDALKGLEGLVTLSSRARRGEGELTLEFMPGQNMDRAMLLVSNRLNAISGYPDEVDEPTLSTSSSDDSPIAWYSVTRMAGNDREIDTYGDFMEDVVKDRIERIPGVSRVNVYGGTPRELRITADPQRLARYRLTVPDVVDALRAANVSASAGKVDEGKRRYTVRVEGELTTPEQVSAVLLRSEVLPDGSVARVSVGDVADVSIAYGERTAIRRFLGEPAFPFNVVRDTGANVMEVMAELDATVADLNGGPMKRQGLQIHKVYDETVYIQSSIDLVVQNIWLGGALAACVLVLFLRRAGPTLVVTMAIPVSIVGAFVGMAALGRSINVISLAGMAFAVGMVVDAAIVVLENIFRLREQGRSRFDAAYNGARQVWGAILVSALTTVMVFLPILTLDLEIGQLFRDIAVAISVSVILSLVVAVTVIPALARRLLGAHKSDASPGFSVPVLDAAAGRFTDAVGRLARRSSTHLGQGLTLVAVIVAGAALASWALLPKLEYLPEGNRNQVSGYINPPPGYNLETTATIAARVEDAVRPLWNGHSGDLPAVESFFFYARDNFAFFGAKAADETRVAELIPVLREPLFAEPGTSGFVVQPSLFGRTVGSGRSIELRVSGADLPVILDVAAQAFDRVQGVLPRADGHQVRPRPGLELGAPEVRAEPDPVRLRDAGVSARTFAQSIDAFNDGLRVAEVTVDGDRIDLRLAGPEGLAQRTQDIDTLPVVTGDGRILPVSSLGTVRLTAGPTEIRHEERLRTVLLQIRPATEMPLGQAMDLLRAEVMQPMIEQGLPDGVRLTLGGTADDLSKAWDAMVWQLALALVIVYLVMAVLFESFIYPLIILVTVPLASAGAVLALGLLNAFVYQPLDMLTLLGFVILIGTVVNNAILLVHQTLWHVRVDLMRPADAIEAATRDRIRPIFMSTLTSLVGMLPLVVMPGAGSELYRGLGVVVLGGLALSAVLTLVVVPPLLALVVHVREARRGRGRLRRTQTAA